jgi:AcrR family transcriptional regulator
MPIVVDHDERRHYIARVVERVIAKQGMDAVTIRNVAREAGFRSTLISHYFKDKKDMLTFTLDSIRSRAAIRVDKEFLEKHDLATCLETLLATNEDELSDWQAWFGFWEKATFDPELSEVRLGVVEATHNTIKNLLERARDRGELPKALDAEFHARRLQIFMNGLAAHVVMKPSDWPAAIQRALVKVEIEFMRKMPKPPAGTELPGFHVPAFSYRR